MVLLPKYVEFRDVMDGAHRDAADESWFDHLWDNQGSRHWIAANQLNFGVETEMDLIYKF